MRAEAAPGLWALVPVKPFREAKQRLAGALDDAARSELARSMLARTLDVLRHADAVAGVVVVSHDPQALQMAYQYGAHGLAETTYGLNVALEGATIHALGMGAQRVLAVPTDLPMLTAMDIDTIAALGRRAPCVVLAQAMQDGGTNALLMNPAGVIRYAFGAQSFAEHELRASRAGARVVVYESERVGFDVDRPEDLARMQVSR